MATKTAPKAGKEQKESTLKGTFRTVYETTDHTEQVQILQEFPNIKKEADGKKIVFHVDDDQAAHIMSKDFAASVDALSATLAAIKKAESLRGDGGTTTTTAGTGKTGGPTGAKKTIFNDPAKKKQLVEIFKSGEKGKGLQAKIKETFGLDKEPSQPNLSNWKSELKEEGLLKD